MERENRDDRFAAMADEYADYTVYDTHYDKIGKVDDLFVDENDRPEYVGVKMGLLGTRSTLIPWEIVRVNEKRRLIEVSESKDRIQDAPTFGNDEEITPEFEERVYNYFGLRRVPAERSAHGAYYRDADRSSRPDATQDVFDRDQLPKAAPDRAERGEPRDRPASPERAGASMHGSRLDGDHVGEDEVRVQRSEEELRVGAREREAGAMNVRKRVRTDRERLSVPKKREDVHVERVPVEGRETVSEEEIGDDEIRVPVVEEEIVVEKRPVVKEELRIRKNVVEDEEIVEEDVRKEEVEIDDQTERRGR